MARKISRLYRELAEIPIYTSAYFLKSNATNSTVRVTTSVRDHMRNIKRTINKDIMSSSLSGINIGTSSQDAEALASVPSPSGKRLGILREVADGVSKKRFVEVWLGNRLEAALEVTKTHEEFHLNPLFFSLSFSKSESSFIYAAEANAPEVDEKTGEETKKFHFIPDLGECLVGKKRPTLYIFRWTAQKLDGETMASDSSEVEGDEDVQTPTKVYAVKSSLPEHSAFVFGQATFAPDENHVFTTGYEQTIDGRRLGPLWCWNHNAAIFKFKLPNKFPRDSEEVTVDVQRLTPSNIAARSPRVTDASAGKPYTVVWLANPSGSGPHASATSLNILHSDEYKSRIIVDYVSEPSANATFPGLYVDQLPSQPFLCLEPGSNTPSHLVTHSFWGSRQTIVAISLFSGDVRELTPGQNEAWKVCGTDGNNGLLAVRSAINRPNELLEAKNLSLTTGPSWKILDKPKLTAFARRKLDAIESSTIPVPHRFPTEVITFQNTGSRGLPLLTVPHGGPHGTYTSEFNPAMVALASDGYIVSLVNYTGSLGFGQKYVEALIGRAGELDVQDVYESAKYLVKLGRAREGSGKQFVQGGSHGGFLSAHLIGQYPDFFSATVMRNPVIAAGEIASVSDIPDWAFAEFGNPFGPRATITSDIFNKLQKASPISHVDAVKAPVLLLVGEMDQRVPPSQSRNYYHALKGRGKVVEMLVFPGNGHSLDSVEAELVGWEAGRDWLEKFSRR